MDHFKLVSQFEPTGDQPQAIDKLVESINSKNKYQTLLGVTGSGKTFTMAKVIEKLNLCKETLDGILCHTGEKMPKTLEGQAVRISDRVAYISHDIEDSIRAEVMTRDDIPQKYRDYFGDTKDSLLDKIIADIYQTSKDKQSVKMSEECERNLNELRAWMFEHVYHSKKTKGNEENLKEIVIKLFNYYKEKEGEQEAIDYVAGMSDEFALNEYKQIYEK